MNRKIRAWSAKEKRYLNESEFVVEPNGRAVLLGNQSEELIREDSTGLPDTNGVEIYEGDIVELEINGIIEKTDVDYDYCGFYPFSTKDSYEYDIWASAYAQNKVSVIGNIHENPEMLNSNGE